MPQVAVEDRKVLTASHIGELLGKSSRTIRGWAKTGQHNFPKPFCTAGHPRWQRVAILKWLSERSR